MAMTHIGLWLGAVRLGSAALRAAGLGLVALALVACGASREHADGSRAYPVGPYAFEIDATLPNLSFEGVDEAGEGATLSLEALRNSGDTDLLLLVVSGGEWCGTCQWLRGRALPLTAETALRSARFDILLGNRDNGPAVVADARQWQMAMAESAEVAAAEPTQFGDLIHGRALPLVLIVERSSMALRDILSNPPTHELTGRVVGAVAEIDGHAPPVFPPPALVDGVFYENEWRLLQATQLPGAPHSDPTNAVADSRAAAELGQALFFDKALSGSGAVSCASCHQLDHQMYDGVALAQGDAIGGRRTPGLALAAHARHQFWDGRADSLWAQALGPLENPVEMNGSRVQIARRLLTQYQDEYLRAFADRRLPTVEDWPAVGRPGMTSYDVLDTGTKDAITQVFVDAGKALAAWERTLRVAPNPLDAYLAGNFAALNAEQKYGLQLFVRQGCMQCHWGPRLTNDAFHNIGVPAGSATLDDGEDQGRYAGLMAARQAEFGASSNWSDLPDGGTVAALASEPNRRPTAEPTERHRGQFKTPPLRGVAHSRFLGHNGSFVDFSALMEVYGWGGQPDAPAAAAGQRDPWLPVFGETAQWGMVPFLKLLTARVEGMPARSGVPLDEASAAH